MLLTTFGCHAFYPPNDDGELQENINSKERLLLKLKDNSELDLSPQAYLFVNEPSDFIYGIGRKLDLKYKTESKFVGMIRKEEIDSSKISESQSNTYYQFWMKNNSGIGFWERNIFFATPEAGNDYWIVFDENANELRKIDNGQIADIQVRKIDWVASSFLLIVCIGAVWLAAGVAVLTGDGILGGGSF